MEAEFVLTPEEQAEAFYDYIQKVHNVRVQSYVTYGVRPVDDNMSIWFTNDSERAGETNAH